MEKDKLGYNTTQVKLVAAVKTASRTAYRMTFELMKRPLFGMPKKKS